MRVSAQFMLSALDAAHFPKSGPPEVAFLGRSNVGKSSLINALVRRPVARTSAEPGKTRLVNLYRIRPAGRPPFYLADLPGYGFARGPAAERIAFEALTDAYFGRQSSVDGQHSSVVGVVLAVDARHPGLPADVAAWTWVGTLGVPSAVAVTKIDKLGRAARAAACRTVETTVGGPVLPVSARTGEGLDDLWRAMLGWTSSEARRRVARARF